MARHRFAHPVDRSQTIGGVFLWYDLIMPPILDLRADELLRAIGFELINEHHPGVRISIYEEPNPARQYCLGADFALGIQGRDKDTMTVLDNTEARKTQVAEVEATLGEVSDKLLWGMAMFYGGAFVLGERQFGLPSLRRLLKDFGYGFQFYERDEKKKTRPVSDKLGYHKAGNWTTDPALRALRRAIIQDDIEVRSSECISQLSRLQFKSRTSIDPEDSLDEDMVVKLAGGGSPDLVMSLAYAFHACREVDHFPQQQIEYPAGSAGDILGHDEVFDQEQQSAYRPGTPTAKRARSLGRIGG